MDAKLTKQNVKYKNTIHHDQFGFIQIMNV